ncbi:MAG: 2-keto-4-pentenoate hydratase/2-oxohepta-3-ene-1,7-dioic acid hydratase in catechol pathway [Glaciecola sp.]|jgi:2-keto-4-pentenoate hydratase/2-oxohepta-3-ene-1,7-dioic acid hydratase in catechol pathway|uniref:fumarylacetoacetate hydrolase family protein n=1 Tax=Congregibacter sp. TaxID=2744308 RepID=UPI0039E7049A
MLSKTLRYSGFIILGLGILTFLAWLTSVDPKFNVASFESESLTLELADLDTALTLAQYTAANGNRVTLLVEAVDGPQVTGVSLRDLGAAQVSDPFSALASIEEEQLKTAFSTEKKRHLIDIASLLPTGPKGKRHLGIGTNFPEHAAEASSTSVFNFPKFGAATPARTTVPASQDSLLDYEVELCMRFDRPIESLADFDAAVKGVFLCADFTDRIALLELADADNLNSGYGFSDAKSGPGFFPTGPFLVIPKDWSTFVANIRMMTFVNGEARQDARGSEMILDFRGLTEKVLDDMTARRFYYDDTFYKLAPNERIDSDMTLMSGTSEGVIFTPPARHDYIEILLAYLLKGGPLSHHSLMDIAIPVFIDNEQASGHFLKPGDTVNYRASQLGDIVVDVKL